VSDSVHLTYRSFSLATLGAPDQGHEVGAAMSLQTRRFLGGRSPTVGDPIAESCTWDSDFPPEAIQDQGVIELQLKMGPGNTKQALGQGSWDMEEKRKQRLRVHQSCAEQTQPSLPSPAQSSLFRALGSLPTGPMSLIYPGGTHFLGHQSLPLRAAFTEGWPRAHSNLQKV
jgi:hypothetical protein